jgi:hypothetical protein
VAISRRVPRALPLGAAAGQAEFYRIEIARSVLVLVLVLVNVLELLSEHEYAHVHEHVLG